MRIENATNILFSEEEVNQWIFNNLIIRFLKSAVVNAVQKTRLDLITCVGAMRIFWVMKYSKI